MSATRLLASSFQRTRNVSTLLAASTRTIASPRSFTTSHRYQAVFKNADQKIFDAQVLEKKDAKTVLVDFSAVWCGPCKVLTPILERVSSSENIDLVIIDVDEQPEIAAKYQIRAMPTVMAFKNGAPVSQFVGALPEPHVKKFLASVDEAKDQ